MAFACRGTADVRLELSVVHVFLVRIGVGDDGPLQRQRQFHWLQVPPSGRRTVPGDVPHESGTRAGLHRECRTHHAKDFDPREMSSRDFYRLLTAVVVPRPIAWVSSTSETAWTTLPRTRFSLWHP